MFGLGTPRSELSRLELLQTHGLTYALPLFQAMHPAMRAVNSGQRPAKGARPKHAGRVGHVMGPYETRGLAAPASPAPPPSQLHPAAVAVTMSYSVSEDVAFSCCASKAFSARLAAAGPFNEFPDLIAAARRIWWNEVGAPEWLAAFAAHPKIGRALRRPAHRPFRGLQDPQNLLRHTP